MQVCQKTTQFSKWLVLKLSHVFFICSHLFRNVASQWVTCALLLQSHRKSSETLACKGGKGVKIRFADCTCYATLRERQGKIVLRCPQKNCHGWRDFDGPILQVQQKHRIWCNVCRCKSGRKTIGEWYCIKCSMIQAHCICNKPETPRYT